MLNCLWCDTYGEAVSSGKSDDEAAELANTAVAENGGQH